MQQKTYETLQAYFEPLPFMKGGAVSSDEIERAESMLNVRFSKDYCEFLLAFGGAIIGAYPIFGLRRAEPMDNNLWSVVNVTEHFREQHWPGLNSAYVVSMDHSGNPIWLDDDGVLRTFEHNSGELLEISQDIESYILSCLSA